MKLLSFGKKFENMFIAIDKCTLGSSFSTFAEKIENGEQIVFVCGSQMWGVAQVCSEVFYELKPIWKDKHYPYRAHIKSIQIFKDPISFVDSGLNKIFRDNLGKQWAYKLLFTPGELPQVAVESIELMLRNTIYLDRSEHMSFLTLHLNEFEIAKRKRLGLE